MYKRQKLTIQERLKDLRVACGLTLEQLSAETGISKSALGKYEADDFKDISPFSMVELAKFYGVSTDYLLGLTEQKNHPNTELDALHLGDDAIEVLRTGKFNHRLLSELICHKDFQRFLLDAEIYVDRIADMRVNDMNAVLEEMCIRDRYEDDFVQRAADQSLRERDKELAQKKDSLAQSQKRIAELDVIIKRLYEDNISGKLSDERFIKLSRDYELEQTNLTNLVEHLRQEVKEQEKQKVNVRQFIAAVRKYTDRCV